MANAFFDFSSPILTYIAVIVLVILAIKLFVEKVESGLEGQHGHFHDNATDLEHEHEHEHPETGLHSHIHFDPKRMNLNLWKLASCAFVLGLLMRKNLHYLLWLLARLTLLLMVTYGLAIATGLSGVTILGVKMYERIKARISRYERYIPKISGVILIAMAVALLLGVL